MNIRIELRAKPRRFFWSKETFELVFVERVAQGERTSIGRNGESTVAIHQFYISESNSTYDIVRLIGEHPTYYSAEDAGQILSKLLNVPFVNEAHPIDA